MWEDPIVEEVRNSREEHAAKFNYDINAIIKDLQEQQRNSDNELYSYLDGEYKVIEKIN